MLVYIQISHKRIDIPDTLPLPLSDHPLPPLVEGGNKVSQGPRVLRGNYSEPECSLISYLHRVARAERNTVSARTLPPVQTLAITWDAVSTLSSPLIGCRPKSMASEPTESPYFLPFAVLNQTRVVLHVLAPPRRDEPLLRCTESHVSLARGLCKRGASNRVPWFRNDDCRVTIAT